MGTGSCTRLLTLPSPGWGHSHRWWGSLISGPKALLPPGRGQESAAVTRERTGKSRFHQREDRLQGKQRQHVGPCRGGKVTLYSSRFFWLD